MKHTLASIVVYVFILPCASADVVTFDNTSGEFVWIASGGLPNPGTPFDPTRGPGEQQATISPRSLIYLSALEAGSNTVDGDGIAGASSMRLARETEPVFIFPPLGGVPHEFFPATVFVPGQVVSDSGNFQLSVATGYFNPILGRHSLIGEHPFIGFRVMLDDGLPHYGYIEFERRQGPRADGETILMFQPVRWAYETEPNTPITVVPAPGAGAVLLLGAVALGARRRRAERR